jgi:hypothetical protein
MERRRSVEQVAAQPPWTTDLRQSFSAFVFGAAVLLAAFILYVWLVREKPKEAFHRVPTMSYYMTDVESSSNVVHVQRTSSSYYTPLAIS